MQLRRRYTYVVEVTVLSDDSATWRIIAAKGRLHRPNTYRQGASTIMPGTVSTGGQLTISPIEGMRFTPGDSERRIAADNLEMEDSNPNERS
jgi:hypothetical protein